MKIGNYEYKNFEYEIHLASEGDWGKHQNHFYTKCEHNFNGDFGLTLDEVNTRIKAQIDDFITTIPHNIDSLLNLIEKHIVWTGYEEAHLDKQTTKTLIEAYIAKSSSK